MRDLRFKTTSFYNSISATDFNFVAISESWLISDIANNELFPDTFTVFWKDCSTNSTGINRGGGVILAANNKNLFAMNVIYQAYIVLFLLLI